MKTGQTRVVLCADDYAQHEGIDAAVCELLAAGRLSAISCMSAAPGWASRSGPRLRELAADASRADIGLHLNLTEKFGEAQASLASLVAKAYARCLDSKVLRRELECQFDAFEHAMTRAPDFVDGHQHVHQLPQVADVTIAILERRYGTCAPWVRNAVPARGTAGAKPAILGLLGGAALARRLRASGIRTNNGFGGVYGFDTDDYAAHFDGWLANAQDGTLLMCHPAASLAAHDPISAQRLVEYRFLRSDAFPAMLAARGVKLAPLSSLLPALEASGIVAFQVFQR